MSLRIGSVLPAGLLIALLSGCPTRPGAEGAPTADPTVGDGASLAPDGSPNVTGAMAVTISDDAGAAPADVADAAPDDLATTVEQTKLPPTLAAAGAVCSVNSDCATGSCVDGVCCSSAACGVCQSCAMPGSLGTCSPLAALAEDPKNSCTNMFACDGKGRCAEFNGNACKSTADCISGFCVDGVCCESSCDQTCYSCNTILSLKGTCQPLTAGTDDSAAVPCSGTKSCAPGPTADQPLCLLNDGQPCAAPSDCISGQCSTFFADRDGDRYGSSSSTISICGPADAPPTGYVAVGGDCCDSDGRAHPGQLSFFSTPDQCGSWDYDCDGYTEEQFTTGPCGGNPAPADCGKTCVAEILGSTVAHYTQACR
jgi:hypothetical protein